jgi:hypothetical protein
MNKHIGFTVIVTTVVTTVVTSGLFTMESTTCTNLHSFWVPKRLGVGDFDVPGGERKSVSPLLLNIYISNLFFIPLGRIFTNT